PVWRKVQATSAPGTRSQIARAMPAMRTREWTRGRASAAAVNKAPRGTSEILLEAAHAPPRTQAIVLARPVSGVRGSVAGSGKKSAGREVKMARSPKACGPAVTQLTAG